MVTESLEDISFKKYPKKVFKRIVIVAMVVAVVWGVVNGDSRKGVKLYFREMEIASIPIKNYIIKQMERTKKIMGWLVERIFQNQIDQ